MAFLNGEGRLALCFAVVLAVAGCDEGPKEIDPKTRAEGLYIHGTTLYLQGNFDESLKAFEEMKTILPDDPRLPAAFGEVYLTQGKLKDSLAQFELAAKKDPKRSTNWSRVGFIQAQLGKNDEARSALRKAIGLNPNDFTALEAIGDIELRAGNVPEASRHYAMAAAASATPATAGQLYVRASRVLQEVNDYDAAAKVLETAISKGAQTPDVQAELGELYIRAGKLEQALPLLTAAAQANLRDPALWQMVGELQFRLDKPGDAIAAFRESLKIKDRAEVHGALARVHRARQDEAAALEELDKALNAATGDEDEARELARLLVEFGKKTEALAILSGLAKEPEKKDDVALQLETAKLAKELGDKQAVTEACERARGAPDAGVTKCP